MEIKLAKSAGFCFGVKRAVDVVEEKIKKTEGPIYTYGPIIHNEEVVNRFKNMGVEVMEEDSDKIYPVGTVIIRSHGITKEVEDKLKADGHTVIDATCPFVKKIHKVVLEHSIIGEYIVIIGNPLHPEVKGITGWINGNDFSVISNIDEVCQLSVNRQQTICIVSQTTFNHNKFEEIVEKIKEKGYHVIVLNTICDATNKRQVEAEEISASVDAMLVIGSKNSSNTQKLYEICKTKCTDTYYLEKADDFQPSLLRSIQSVGITAGASTPNYIIEEVQNNVRNEL